jgi:hypothetical protein
MHESSPRPFFGRERNDGWKTASVEGMCSGFKVAWFEGFKTESGDGVSEHVRQRLAVVKAYKP